MLSRVETLELINSEKRGAFAVGVEVARFDMEEEYLGRGDRERVEATFECICWDLLGGGAKLALYVELGLTRAVLLEEFVRGYDSYFKHE
jgi:hypothetical protein